MSIRSAVLAVAAAAFAGCATVFDAREAQRDILVKSSDGASSSVSPPPLPAGLSLAGMVGFAMDNRPSLASARLAVEDARLALRQAAADAPIASDTPWNAARLSVSAGHSESSRSEHLEDFKWKTSGDPSASVSLELLLWDFGRNDALAMARAEEVVAAESSLAKEGSSVFKEVADAHFGLLEARTLLEVAETNVAVRAMHLDQSERMFAEGEAKRLDVLRARLDLAGAKERLVAASNDVATAEAELVRALGASGGAAAAGGSLLSFAVQAFPETCDSAGIAARRALENAPSMRVARARLRAASAEVDGAIADLYPSVSATASLSWTDPLWLFRWGISAAQSLFTGFRKTVAVDRAVVAMRKAATAVDAAGQDLVRDVELAVASRDNAREARRAAEESLASARENLETVSARYGVGEASRVDFADAVDDYVAALGSRASAFYRGQRAEAALFALAGTYPVYDERKVSLERQ